ncbi:MAG: hypothetical protein DWQ34_04920 [Planctomycetota bacterium]|nr:MAG: hypothetical protein DWQ29_19090 [Planctomycetota bacterium]REJ96068.1 MAG: hypothetical protein DWQ34_04920 [Planctomycetota bacterium]REK31067.1 MAG: hypothetical protein DWQ41_01180 [Planctomycetota bacterium]REK36819.1 MAG: hypothetical protein DWQ45_09440 [Planctomycetota bacterium]
MWFAVCRAGMWMLVIGIPCMWAVVFFLRLPPAFAILAYAFALGIMAIILLASIRARLVVHDD